MKKTILTLSILAAISLSGYAQSMPSLFIPSDPVAAGLALSTLARDATAYAAADNASAMAFSETRFKGGLSYGMWQPSVADSKTVNAGTFLKMNDRISVGFAASYILDKETSITNFNGAVTGTFTPKDIVARVGASYLINDNLSVGVTAKMLHSSISPELSGSAFGGDISAMYKKESWSASAALCNLGTAITYSESYSMPMCFKAGARVSFWNFTVSAEADYLFDGAFSAAAGAEYDVSDIFFTRIGYHYGSSDKGLPSFASIGCGVKLWGIELNLGCMTLSDTLGETAYFGLAYSF